MPIERRITRRTFGGFIGCGGLSWAARATRADHPVTKGVRDFVVTDEQHFMTYDKDPKYALARSFNEDGLDYTDQTGRRSNTAEAAWAYDYRKGRVCFMAPGAHGHRLVESRIRKDAKKRCEVVIA